MILPLAIHAALHAKREARRVAPWWACFGLLAAGLMFSVSRSAIIGVAEQPSCSSSAGRRGARIWMAATGVGFVLVIGIAAPGLLNTFRTLFQDAGQVTASSGRLHDYDTARQASRSTSGWAGGRARGTRPSTRSSTTST